MARVSRKNRIIPEESSMQVMKTGLYVRLSDEDNGGKSKDGVHNQLELLLDFARKLENVEVLGTYIDNGQTGTDFDRPEWERLMEDVKEQKINCIIVKDLSRFARNYLEAGDYLEKVFPFMGVRFIAVNDRFDSAGEIFRETELITEFKNLANDYYSKDISKKVMTAFQTKKSNGQFIGSKAPYGYILKDNHFIVDEPAAAIVRRIFEMKSQGISAYEIANILNKEGVSSPSRYAGEQGQKKYKHCEHILWQAEAVTRILYNQAYVGDLVQGKYNRSIFSKEEQGLREEKAWEVIENAHEPIIRRDLFLEIQELKEKNRKVWKERQGRAGYKNVLEGILVCGVCQHVMRRNKDVRNGKVRYYFYCASENGYLHAKCNTSSIVDHKVFHMVLEQIKLQIDLAVEMEHFIKKIKESGKCAAAIREKKQCVEQIRSELQRYIYLRTSIYEDMKQGILTKEEFLAAKERYSVKITQMESELKAKEGDLAEFEKCVNGSNRWMQSFLSFRDAKELTREMALALLEKVEIYEDKRIHIKFRFRNEYEYLASHVITQKE